LLFFFSFQAIVNRRSHLFSLFLPIELLGSSRKEHIAAAIKGGFDGVLDDTDDETFFLLRKKKLPIFQI